jgi:predicted RNA methylase
MVRLLSFIYPITKKVKSEFNGTLEITWYNGKKHLNTKNANYSYGSLQKILKFGLDKMDLSKCNSVLILGLGGGSVIPTLEKIIGHNKSIMSVELDPIIIKVAKEEFKLSEIKNLEIICDDASNFMMYNKSIFDLIIVDLFIDTEIPSPFFEIPFWKNIVDATSKNGNILFNASLDSKNECDIINIASYLYKNKFEIEKLEKVNKTNTLLLAKR